jgi:SAM-dependent methyltransferase
VASVDFIGSQHRSTKRDYVQRVVEFDKAHCAEVAKQWGYDYWDGERQYGFGGYSYDGRWLAVAERIAAHYGIKPGDRILDIGCGKAFLLYEFTRVVPGVEVRGIDVSRYALDNAKEEICNCLDHGSCTELPYEDGAFDLVYSINTFHNLRNFELMAALREMQRVTKTHSFICVESYRNEREKANLLYWQLTCESFYSPEEWQWFYDFAGYRGDQDFIFFD